MSSTCQKLTIPRSLRLDLMLSSCYLCSLCGIIGVSTLGWGDAMSRRRAGWCYVKGRRHCLVCYPQPLGAFICYHPAATPTTLHITLPHINPQNTDKTSQPIQPSLHTAKMHLQGWAVIIKQHKDFIAGKQDSNSPAETVSKSHYRKYQRSEVHY